MQFLKNVFSLKGSKTLFYIFKNMFSNAVQGMTDLCVICIKILELVTVTADCSQKYAMLRGIQLLISTELSEPPFGVSI